MTRTPSLFGCEDLAFIASYFSYRAFGLSPATAIACARRDADLIAR